MFFFILTLLCLLATKSAATLKVVPTMDKIANAKPLSMRDIIWNPAVRIAQLLGFARPPANVDEGRDTAASRAFDDGWDAFVRASSDPAEAVALKMSASLLRGIDLHNANAVSKECDVDETSAVLASITMNANAP